MNRYSKILEKNRQEILLLKSLPCSYGKCAFCNYILDNSTDPDEIYRTNIEAINQVSGEFGVLEIINSSSALDLPETTLQAIKQKAIAKGIKILYFEAYYWGKKEAIDKIRKYFSGIELRFRIGVETFDNKFRKEIYKKPFPIDDIEKLANLFHGCYLLVCARGQTKRQILRDIELAQKYFKETRVNIFVNNETEVKRDEKLLKWFLSDVYPGIKALDNFEILIDSKDLGVYVQ